MLYGKLDVHAHGEESEDEAEAELEVRFQRVERPDDSIPIGVEEDDMLLEYGHVLVGTRPVALGSTIRVVRVGRDVGARDVCWDVQVD
jgi:hypothetical protein